MIDQKLEVTNLITPLIKTYVALNNEWKNLFKIGIEEYLQSQTEKYYYTNTFLHRTEKVKFFDIYYPIKASYGTEVTTDFMDLTGLMETYKFITLIGSAGSGKTTLMKHFFLTSIIIKDKIPLFIELRNLNDYKGDLKALIVEKILNSKIKPSEGTLTRALESGAFLFLLDGYDEIFSDKKQEINRQIESFVDIYSANNFIITTRPGSGIESTNRFYNFNVCELSKTDVNKFINKLVTHPERKARILKIIKDPSNKTYMEYLKNPLLLSMFIMAFENHPEIPSRKSAFYRNVFDTLYSKHDGITKNSFPREKITKLQRDDFEKTLCIFSYLTLIDGKYSFTEEYLADTLIKVRENMKLTYKIEDLIYDLRTTISILLLDGFEYSFPHRSMQEYFAAQFISNLPSEKKEKAYNNLFKALRASSTDNSLNLWTICNELDSYYFTLHFTIPELKKLSSLLAKRSDNELLITYFKTYRLMFFYNSNVTSKNKLIIAHIVGFNTAFNRFSKAYINRPITYFIEESGCEKELLALVPNEELGRDRFISSFNDNPQVKTILIKYGICKIIRKFKPQVEKRIKEYKNQIISEKSSLDDLLNI